MAEPVQQCTTLPCSTARRCRLAWFAVVMVAAALDFSCNGQHRLLDPDEGRYAEISREMIESGDFITPRLNYVKYFEKPPLLYWAVAAAMAAFGPQEWAMRGVCAGASLLAVLVTMGLAARMFSRQIGVLAGWVLSTALLPLIMARLLTTDALFSLCLTASWAAWWLGYGAQLARIKKAWYVAAWACLGLAVMTRGPVAMALSGAIVILFLLARRDLAEFRAVLAWPGVLAFALITIPWFYLVSARNPEFLHFFFVVQHFQRFLGETKEHIKPFWFFVPIAILGMGGWAMLTLPAFWAALCEAAASVRAAWRTAPREARHQSVSLQDAAVVFLGFWVLIVVGFFSASKCKLVPYILPAFPALAVLVAWYLDNGGARRPVGRLAALAAAALLAAGVLVINRLATSQEVVPHRAIATFALGLRIALAAGALGLLLGAICPRVHALAAGLALLLAFPPMAATVPVVAKYKRVGALVTQLPPLPPQVRVAELDCYDQSLGFYLRRRIVLVNDFDELVFGHSVEPAPEFFLRGEESLRALAARWPVLVNVHPRDWPRLRQWGILHPVIANTSNLFLGNASFFQLTGLRPWPDDAVKQGPLLLMPQPQRAWTGR